MIDKNMYYNGYEGSVEWSDPDNVWHGRLCDIRDIISYEGDDKEQLEERFREAVDDYLEWCAEKGVPPQKP